MLSHILLCLITVFVTNMFLQKETFGETFYVLENKKNVPSEPLILNTYHIVNPQGWKWYSKNTISTVINIRAKKGQMNYKDIMAIPDMGYHRNSGLEYSNINKIQGTNGWEYLNESRHDHEWFRWRPTLSWQRKSHEEKTKGIQIRLLVNAQKETGLIFPVSFGLKIHDFNYNKVSRVWITFTSNPVITDVKTPLISIHHIHQPLMLQSTNINITNGKWKKKNKNILVSTIQLKAEQGEIDFENITGKDKNSQKWFSWSLVKNFEDKNTLSVICKVNNNYSHPNQFPYVSKISVKDKNIPRYIIVQLVLLHNPLK